MNYRNFAEMTMCHKFAKILAFIYLRVEFLNRTQKNFFCAAIEQRTLLPRSRSERSENNSAAENAVEGRRLSNRIAVIFRVLPVVIVDCRCTGLIQNLSSSKYGCIIHDGLNRMGNYSCGTAENILKYCSI